MRVSNEKIQIRTDKFLSDCFNTALDSAIMLKSVNSRTIENLLYDIAFSACCINAGTKMAGSTPIKCKRFIDI